MTSCKETPAKPQQNVRRIFETLVTGPCDCMLTGELKLSQTTVPVLAQHGHSLPGGWFDHFGCLLYQTETPVCSVGPTELSHPGQPSPSTAENHCKPQIPGSLGTTAKPWGRSSRPLQARGTEPPLQEWGHSPERLGHLCPISRSSPWDAYQEDWF